MEVTKQKIRCAAAEDPSYPCKHHREEQVSQLPGEEVTAACLEVPVPRCHWGKSWVQPDTGVPWAGEGAAGGTPRAAVTYPGSGRAGQRAGQCVWPGLCSQLPCHYVPAQPCLTEQKSGPCSAPVGKGLRGEHQLHVYMYPNMYPAQVPRGGGLFPKCHQLKASKGPALTLGTLSAPKGVALGRASAPQGSKPRVDTVLGLAPANTEGHRATPRHLADQQPQTLAKGPHTRTTHVPHAGCRGNGGVLSTWEMGLDITKANSWALPAAWAGAGASQFESTGVLVL